MNSNSLYVLLLILGFISCKSETKKSPITKIPELNSSSNHTEPKNLKIEDANVVEKKSQISDSIPTFIVDDYLVLNKMFKKNRGLKKSAELISFDKVWFGNDSLKQTLVFELYTDYHRLITYHFYNYEIPLDLIKHMELHTESKNIASQEQKKSNFGGFLEETTKIDSKYFITKKKFKLGNDRQQAINEYGIPDSKTIANGIEKLEWEFIGDMMYNKNIDLKGKPLAKYSFGYQVIMYFKKDKLIGMILYNDIP